MSTVFEAARGADCVRAAQMLGLRVRRSGSRAYACCLFHAERTPSMCLYPDGGGFYCFGCHAHGDAIDLYARALNCPPLEAARQVCRDFGLPYDEGKRRWRAPGAQAVPRPDARALAGQLEELRRARAGVLQAAIESTRVVMARVEAAKAPEAAMDDADWQRALRLQAAARDQLARLEAMTPAELYAYFRAGDAALSGAAR